MTNTEVTDVRGAVVETTMGAEQFVKLLIVMGAPQFVKLPIVMGAPQVWLSC